MKIQLDRFVQVHNRRYLYLIPVFEGTVRSSAREYGFEGSFAQAWGFEGKSLQTLPVELQSSQALLIGAGKAKEFSSEQARQVIATGVRSGFLQKSKAGTVVFVASALVDTKIPRVDIVEALAEGATLGSYAFVSRKGRGTEKDTLPRFPDRLTIALERIGAADRERFGEGLTLGRWTNWARDVLNEAQSQMSARQLADLARRTALRFKKVQCRILGEKEIRAKKMGLLLAVNQGSTEPPRFIVLQYRGGQAGQAPICLIGKGLTFDTGGYNLKPTDSIKGMHMDKGGGVAALASFFAAVELGVRKNLICLVPSTDNRVSGSAMCPGDVFVGMNGISVEIDNTDAEGRLILADALTYAGEFKPSHIVDMATLTGAAVIALGDQASAMFNTDNRWSEELLAHAADAGELLWRMPLWKQYQAKFKSQVADIKNAGNRWAGAITAALFLQRFVPDGVLWCHLDMAGKMKAESDEPYNPAGSAYGFGPRLLGRWLRSASIHF